MSSLAGARVALLEARLASEMAALIRREGGEPVSAPAVCEARMDVSAMIPSFVRDIRDGQTRVMVFLTGAGADSLFAQAEEIGELSALIEACSTLTTVCRGPKPSAVLRRHGIPIVVCASSPHTTTELLAALAHVPVRGRGIAVLHDGGTNPALVAALRAEGALVRDIRTYEWQLPADTTPIAQLVHDLIAGRIDALAVTSQVQIRHLFQVGDGMDLRLALRLALENRTIVGSIGPTCTTVLQDFGVTPHVEASPPRMRPLINAIAVRLASRPSTPAQVYAR